MAEDQRKVTAEWCLAPLRAEEEGDGGPSITELYSFAPN
jgi:hypothetical protein